ncbi:hypothetical protein B484DRAFT_422373 [Ochromonadaceae sp. CCMP2298]|nr:hypothetical protein B484DRAFT_422373 [Ochromonadaceae sp. CCMP2298]
MDDLSTFGCGFMRESMLATAELVNSIEQDIQESRFLVRASQSDRSILTELVGVLQRDNRELTTRLAELEDQHAQQEEEWEAQGAASRSSEEEMFIECEGRILACNGEIERVVLQCDEANAAKREVERLLAESERQRLALEGDLRLAQERAQRQGAAADKLAEENASISDKLAQLQRSLFIVEAELQLQRLDNMNRDRRDSTDRRDETEMQTQTQAERGM